MNPPLITLEASTTNELSNILFRLPEKDIHGCHFAALALSAPQVMIYPFTFKNTSPDASKKQVFTEIKEILSLPASEIVHDFQIFHHNSDRTTGVCAAVSKAVFQKYIEILDARRLVPLRVIPYIASNIDYYYQKHKERAENFAIIDFSQKHMVNLAVFHKDQCELLRQIPFTYFKEGKSEILESLRNVCLLSAVKKLDHIYFAGHLDDKQEFMAEVESIFQTTTAKDHSVDIATALSLDDHYFTLNLAKDYTFTLPQRKRIKRKVALLSIFFGLIIILFAFKIIQRVVALRQITSSYSVADYIYAVNLKDQLGLE